MQRTEPIQIPQNSPFTAYCEAVCFAHTNLYNRTLFLERQCLTSYHKSDEQLSDNEREVLQELNNALPSMGMSYGKPQKRRPSLSYSFLARFCVATHDKDYYQNGFSAQAAQQTLKQVVNDMDTFWKAKKAYDNNPEKFKGRPKLPHYKKPGSLSTVTFTNQDCRYEPISQTLKFPKTKLRLPCRPISGTIKEVKIKPTHGIFIVLISYEEKTPEAKFKEPERVAAIDPGVSNIITMVNNLGKQNLLFKGGVAKSVNQRFNKQLAEVRSSFDRNEISEDLYRQKVDELSLRRNNILSDLFHKMSKAVIDYCLNLAIDTIVIGKNKYWKQEITDLNPNDKQHFVYLPFTRLFAMIEYKAEAQGIRVIFQEESYTSQASFLDDDDIPTYGEIDSKPDFNGYRKNRWYKRKGKKDGWINADINGAANIGRKAFPQLFPSHSVDFTNTKTIVHPDYESRKWNQQWQATHYRLSNAKLRRQRCKQSNPSRVRFCE